MHTAPPAVQRGEAKRDKAAVKTEDNKPRAPQLISLEKLTAERALLYADPSLVIVNKPAGLVTQGISQENFSQDDQAERFQTLLRNIENYQLLNEPLLPLHRLDKYTTGALALATDKRNARLFSQQFASREVKKSYLALVVGGPDMFPNSEGVITDPLVATNGHVDVFFDDNRPRFIKPAVQRSADSRGENWKKNARTDYEVVARAKDLPLILVKLSPHTGLKRQLRAHAAQSLRTPILGDSTYRLSSKSKMMRDLRSAMTIPKTVFLHSWELTVTRYSPSPFELTIRAPLPVHFLNVLAHARVGMSLPRKVISGGVWIDDEQVAGFHFNPAIRQKGDFSKDSPAAKLLSIGGKWYGPTQYTQFQKKNKAKPDSRWRRPSKLPASPSLPASSRVEE